MKNGKNHNKVILFSSTLTRIQCDTGNVTFLWCCEFNGHATHDVTSHLCQDGDPNV